MDGTVSRGVMLAVALVGMLLALSMTTLQPCFEDGTGVCLTLRIK